MAGHCCSAGWAADVANNAGGWRVYRRGPSPRGNPLRARTCSAGDQAGGVDGSSSIASSSSRAEDELEVCIRAAGQDWLRWCLGRSWLPTVPEVKPPLTEAWERSTTQLLSHTSSSASSTGRAGAWSRNMARGLVKHCSARCWARCQAGARSDGLILKWESCEHGVGPWRGWRRVGLARYGGLKLPATQRPHTRPDGRWVRGNIALVGDGPRYSGLQSDLVGGCMGLAERRP